MLVLFAAAVLAQPAATLPRLDAKRCVRPGAEMVDARHPVRARKLGDMPPAKQVLGVYREVGGCPSPAVVREEVGTPEPLTTNP